uniref:RRM domain-containing protein n=1 Tax=Panagrolaimus sp. JU765 TaxID=591449 RepID=A0AC34RLX5_9BILA
MNDQNLSEEEGHEPYFDDETNDDESSRPEGSAAENTPAAYDETDNKICPIDSTLWMSDIDEKWDQEFIKKCFEHFDYYPKNIKVINDKAKSRPYAFIEFDSADVARKALLKVNGRTIPNDPERRKFHLSYANL